jgi:DNA-binding MarR family transcriptional regulator
MTASDSVDACIDEIASHYPEAIHPEVEGVVDRVAAIHKHVQRAFDDTLEKHGLNHGEYKLLLRLATRSPEHRLSAGALSKALMLSSGAMTNRLDRLETAGLIRRVPDPRDRRGVLVELTEAGRSTIDGAVEEQAAKERDVLCALSVKELVQVNALLRKVLLSLEDAAHSGAVAS